MTIQVMGHYSGMKHKTALVDQSPLSNIDSEAKKSLGKVPKPAKKATGDKTQMAIYQWPAESSRPWTGLKIRRDIIIHVQDVSHARLVDIKKAG